MNYVGITKSYLRIRAEKNLWLFDIFCLIAREFGRIPYLLLPKDKQ
jgi:hypothetical protein